MLVLCSPKYPCITFDKCAYFDRCVVQRMNFDALIHWMSSDALLFRWLAVLRSQLGCLSFHPFSKYFLHYFYLCYRSTICSCSLKVSLFVSFCSYVALFPCNECAKVIIQAGITEVVYISDKVRNSESCSYQLRNRMEAILVPSYLVIVFRRQTFREPWPAYSAFTPTNYRLLFAFSLPLAV